MSFHLTYLFVVIECGISASGVALFHGDKAAECNYSAWHHEKQSAAEDKATSRVIVAPKTQGFMLISLSFVLFWGAAR